ncbi:methyltransferase [Inquilinus sp. CA228]|uniref:methyltransferase n=1 Tax=Inquilinus sp. CA228 TaxID=3455609 RepID=UPI003F8D5E65
MYTIFGDIGTKLIAKHGGGDGLSAEFKLLGRQWYLLPEVFAPPHTASTALFAEWLPYPIGGRFLEVGSGAGVIAVVAAQRGCASVTALDIGLSAVANTVANVVRHGVSDRVRVLHSDLFEALHESERFDMIFWNSNFVEAPETFEYRRDVERAICDPGYAAHGRYLREGGKWLTPNGRLLLGFSSLGNQGRLQELARQAGLQVSVLNRFAGQSAGISVEFQLLELRPS